MTAKPTRKQQTRRRRRAVFILLFAAVLCGVGFYCVSVFCRATHIEVTGSTRYAAEDIIEAADIGEEQNIFTISQKALNERITALCPYIECVTLHRRLPDTLELELHEFNTIYACIGSMGRVTTLSADGKVLEQCASLPEYTCLLLGADFSGYTAGEKLPEEWQKTLAGVDKVRAALEDAGMLPEIGYIEIGMSFPPILSGTLMFRSAVGPTPGSCLLPRWRMHNIWPFWVENSSRYTPFGLHFHDVSVMID